MLKVFEKLKQQVNENKPVVLVTIIDLKGSVPGKVGFKMLVSSEGRIYGTIGGGGVEFYAINKCRDLLGDNKRTLTQTFLLKESDSPDTAVREEGSKVYINALCGGEVTIFYEVYKPEKTIHIFGAGHVAQAVSNIAKTLRFNIALYDFREDILNEFPGSQYDRKSLLDFSKLSVMDKEEIILDDKDFVLIMTHNHIHDIEVLKFIYRNYPQMNYIGMIGSRRKVYEAVTIIKEHFGSSINLKNLYAPVGINIGGDLPEEIALSIMAEIQSNVYNRNQHHLRLDELNE